jgi:hypothetical protein
MSMVPSFDGFQWQSEGWHIITIGLFYGMRTEMALQWLILKK